MHLDWLQVLVLIDLEHNQEFLIHFQRLPVPETIRKSGESQHPELRNYHNRLIAERYA